MAVLAASGAVGALGYACGRARPVRKARNEAAWRLWRGDLAPHGWPKPAQKAAAWGWVALRVATDPRGVATLLWEARNPSPEPDPVRRRALTAAEREEQERERAAEEARPPRLEFSTAHAPWWEPRRGVQLVHAGTWSARPLFWTAAGARRFGRKALAVAEGRR